MQGGSQPRLGLRLTPVSFPSPRVFKAALRNLRLIVGHVRADQLEREPDAETMKHLVLLRLFSGEIEVNAGSALFPAVVVEW